MNTKCRRIARLLSLSAIALIPAMTGCGSGRVATYPVTGSVRFDDGEPVRFGVIEFRPDSGGTSARAQLGRDGSFILGTYAVDDGAAEGSYRVIVVQHFNMPPRASRAQMPSEHAEHAANSHANARVATEFTDYSASSLRANVQPHSENEFDFVVKRHQKSTATSETGTARQVRETK
jgi:hypothetical protein